MIFISPLFIVLYLKRKKKKEVSLRTHWESFKFFMNFLCGSACYTEVDSPTARQVTLEESPSLQPQFPPSKKRVSVIEDDRENLQWSLLDGRHDLPTSQTLVSFWIQSVDATVWRLIQLSDHMEQGGACVSGHLKMEQNLLDRWKLIPPLLQAGVNLYGRSG